MEEALEANDVEYKFNNLKGDSKNQSRVILSIQCEVLDQFKQYLNENDFRDPQKLDTTFLNNFSNELEQKFNTKFPFGMENERIILLTEVLSQFANQDFLLVLEKVSNGNKTLCTLIKYFKWLQQKPLSNMSQGKTQLDIINQEYHTEFPAIYYPKTIVKKKALF